MTLRFFRSSYGPLLFPILLALIVHTNVLFNGFGWDDQTIIQNLKFSEDWVQAFLPNPGLTSKSHAAYYRPLVGLSYQLDLLIWGDSPFGFHFSVYLAHVLNTLLVYLLTLRLMKIGQTHGSVPTNRGGPLESGRNELRPTIFIPPVAASLFAVHPIHTEAVAWIAGRNDVFCTFFLLVSFVLYTKTTGEENKKLEMGKLKHRFIFILSMLFFFLALLTKEAAISLVLIFPLYDYLIHYAHPTEKEIEKMRNRKLSQYFPIFLFSHFRALTIRYIVPLLIIGFYFTLRSARVHAPYGGTESIGTFISLSSINNAVAAAALYLKMMIFPYPHAPFIIDLPHGTFVHIIGWIGVISLMGLGIISVIRRLVLPAIGITWTLFFLAPPVALSVLGIASTRAAERYVYAPSVGLLIATAWVFISATDRLIQNGFPARRVWGTATGFLVILVVLGSWISYQRIPIWQDLPTFWKTVVETSPQSGFPYRELALQYYQSGRYDSAEPLYQKAIAFDEAALGQNHRLVAENLNDLAALYYARKEYQKAEPLYKRSVAIKESLYGPLHPEVAQMLNNLGVLYNVQGQNDKAESFFQRSLSIREKSLGPDHPDTAKSLNNLAGLYYSRRQYPEAETLFKRSHAIREKAYRANHPSIAISLSNLASVYEAQGKFLEAEPIYKRSVSIYQQHYEPGHPERIREMKKYANLLRKLKRENEAVEIERQINRTQK